MKGLSESFYKRGSALVFKKEVCFFPLISVITELAYCGRQLWGRRHKDLASSSIYINYYMYDL